MDFPARFLALEHPDGYAFELTVGTPLAADSPSKPGFSVLFEDAGKMGMTFEAPDVNRGRYRFEPVSDTVIRYGLGNRPGRSPERFDRG